MERHLFSTHNCSFANLAFMHAIWELKKLQFSQCAVWSFDLYFSRQYCKQISIVKQFENLMKFYTQKRWRENADWTLFDRDVKNVKISLDLFKYEIFDSKCIDTFISLDILSNEFPSMSQNTLLFKVVSGIYLKIIQTNLKRSEIHTIYESYIKTSDAFYHRWKHVCEVIQCSRRCLASNALILFLMNFYHSLSFESLWITALYQNYTSL